MVIAVNQRHKATVWKERIAACRSSGQTVANWCTENCISKSTYYHWKRKLVGEAGNEIACAQQSQQLQRFAEIPPMSYSCATDVVTVLRAGELTCELRQGITHEQLCAIVQGLASHA